MKGIPERDQRLQIQHFRKTDPAYGTCVAKGLGLDIQEIRQGPPSHGQRLSPSETVVRD
jgi:hypothetical protein